MLIQPNGLPTKRKREQLLRQDVKTVVEFEQWCRQHKLSLDLYCDKCADTYGPSGARCWGNNGRDSKAYHLECQCTDRVYGTDVGATPRLVTPVADPKIQVVVP